MENQTNEQMHKQRVIALQSLIITAMKKGKTNNPNEELAVVSEAFLCILNSVGTVMGYSKEQNFPKMVLQQLINQI